MWKCMSVFPKVLFPKVTGVNSYNLKNELHGLIILENSRMNRLILKYAKIH